MIKMSILHKSSVVSELSICIYISSSAIFRIREHVKQVESVRRANKYILEINIDIVKTRDKLMNKISKNIQISQQHVCRAIKKDILPLRRHVWR